MSFCSRCGTELASGTASCPQCGESSKSDARTATIALASVFGLAFLLSLCSINRTASKVPPSLTRSESSQPEDFPVKTDEIYAKESSQSRCSERYPVDFAMQAACGRNADEGRAAFVEIWNRYLDNSAMNTALQACFSRYTERNITDFAMAGACARNQEEGLKEIRK